jgi:hypothetical protein
MYDEDTAVEVWNDFQKDGVSAFMLLSGYPTATADDIRFLAVRVAVPVIADANVRVVSLGLLTTVSGVTGKLLEITVTLTVSPRSCSMFQVADAVV